MKIQLNTDHNVDSTQAIDDMVAAEVHAALGRFEDRLTRVEVHLGDENAEKDGGGADKRCMLEVRPNGMQPLVVTDFADTFDQAVSGAAKKMQHRLDSTFGRLDRRG